MTAAVLTKATKARESIISDLEQDYDFDYTAEQRKEVEAKADSLIRSKEAHFKE